MVLLITFSSPPASPIVAVELMMICSQAMATSTAWPFMRLGHIGDRAGPVELVAGEEAGQLVGVFELGALAGVGGPFRHDEFEHEDGPLVAGGGQGPLDRLLHAEHDAVIDRQGNADPLALPAGAIFLTLRGPVGLRGRLLRLVYMRLFRGGSEKAAVPDHQPAGRIPAGEGLIAGAQQKYR